MTPQQEKTATPIIIAAGVPLKNCPTIPAKTTDPIVAKALTTLAAVPAIWPKGSIAKAVKFPMVIPAWKKMPNIQNTNMANPRGPVIRPAYSSKSIEKLHTTWTLKAALTNRRIPNLITNVAFTKLAEAAKMGMERIVVSGLGQNEPSPPDGLTLVKVSRVGELQKVLF